MQDIQLRFIELIQMEKDYMLFALSVFSQEMKLIKLVEALKVNLV